MEPRCHQGGVQLRLSKEGSEARACEKDTCRGVALGSHGTPRCPSEEGTGHQPSGIAWRLLDVATRVPAVRQPRQHRDVPQPTLFHLATEAQNVIRTRPSAGSEAVTAGGSGAAPPAPGRWPRSLSEMQNHMLSQACARRPHHNDQHFNF